VQGGGRGCVGGGGCCYTMRISGSSLPEHPEGLDGGGGRRGQLRGTTGQGGVEVGEDGVEVKAGSGGTIGEADVSYDGIAGDAEAEVEVAELTHQHIEGDIYDIISGSAAVGETTAITVDHAEGILGAGITSGDRVIQAKDIAEGASLEEIEAGYTDEECLHDILTREVGGGEGGEGG
jgi:hypothetical protein